MFTTGLPKTSPPVNAIVMLMLTPLYDGVISGHKINFWSNLFLQPAPKTPSNSVQPPAKLSKKVSQDC
jgi:hypothetical protein